MPRTLRRNPHEHALRDAALAYPEAREAFPWGHRVAKVRGKIFVVLSKDEPGLSVSVKLPWSAEGALQFPFCAPTGYGLGRAGWVTATFGDRERPPLDMLRSWIDESYRAVAPKRLAARVESVSVSGASAGAGAAARTTKARTAKAGAGKAGGSALPGDATRPSPPPQARPRARASAGGRRARGAARSPR